MATLDLTGPRRITDLAVVTSRHRPGPGDGESGLVERKGDPSDKRVTLVCLTAAGLSYFRARRQAGVDAYARLIDELTGDEVEASVAALPVLLHLAELESQVREESVR